MGTGIPDKSSMMSCLSDDSGFDEAARLAALESYGILDTPPEDGFDDLVRLVAGICGTPIAVINLIADDRQWFKAETGLGIRETPVGLSICAKILRQPGVTVIPDLTRDDRFVQNPLVAGEPYLRFYAGALLETPDGHPLGTLCVLDHSPRPGLTADQENALRVLARQVMAQFELRRARAEAQLRSVQHRFVTDALPVLISYVDAKQRYRYVNRVYEDWFGRSRASVLGQHLRDVVGDAAYEVLRPHVETALLGKRHGVEAYVPYPRGARHIQCDYVPDVDPDGRVVGYYSLVQDITDRKRDEEALRASEARLQVALAAGRLGSWEFEVATGAVRRTLRHDQIFGYEELLPEPTYQIFLSHVLPEDRDRVDRVFRAALEQGGDCHVECRIRRTDGEVRWIEAHGSPAKGADGRVVRVVGVVADISDRKRAEEALREQARVLEILNATGAALAAERNIERLVQMVTDAGAELIGAAFGAFFYHMADPVDGETFDLYALSGAPREAFAKFPKPRNTALFAPTFRGEAVVRSDDITKDPRYGRNAPHRGMPPGHLRVRSYLAVPVVARSGEVLGSLLFGHPEPARFATQAEALIVSLAAQAAVAIENARLNRSLRDSEDRLRLALDAANMGSWDYDPISGRTIWSDRAKALFGLPPTAEVSNDIFLSGLHPEDRERVEEIVSKALDPNGTGEYEAEFRAIGVEDGVERWIAARGRAYFADGRAVRFIGTTQDATPRKRSEAEREAALAQRTLMLKELHHRVKNSLQSVASLLRLQGFQAQEPRVREEFRKACERIETIAEVHTHLYRTDDIERLEFGAFLRDLCARLGKSLLPEDGRIILNVEAETHPVVVERAIPLSLLVNELVTNAVKHAFPDDLGGRIDVRFHRHGSGFRLSVHNTGRDLPEGAETAGGLGFRLVRALSQQVGAATHIGRGDGTRFDFDLPE